MIYYGRTKAGRIKSVNVLERIWSNCENFSDEECWVLNHKSVSIAGHLRIRRDDSRKIMIHRLAWEAHNAEPIPEGMLLCHHCDNPACFNPHHLFLGTQKDNMRDKINKGRARYRCKIDKEQRKKIRNSQETVKNLALKYNVTPTRIRQIQKGN